MNTNERDKKIRVLDEYLLSSSESYSPGIELSLKQKLPDGRIISKTIEAEPHTFTIKQSNLSTKKWDTITRVGDFRIARSKESDRVACFKASNGRFISWLEDGDMVRIALDLLQCMGIKPCRRKDGRYQLTIPTKLHAKLHAAFVRKSANFPSRSRVYSDGDSSNELS